jgi:hypothetical protein
MAQAHFPWVARKLATQGFVAESLWDSGRGLHEGWMAQFPRLFKRRSATRAILGMREDRLLIKRPSTCITKPRFANIQERNECDHWNRDKKNLRVAAAYVGNKAAEDNANENDKGRKYSPFECRISPEVEEKSTGNAQCDPNDHEGDEKIATVSNTCLC